MEISICIQHFSITWQKAGKTKPLFYLAYQFVLSHTEASTISCTWVNFSTHRTKETTEQLLKAGKASAFIKKNYFLGFKTNNNINRRKISTVYHIFSYRTQAPLPSSPLQPPHPGRWMLICPTSTSKKNGFPQV